MTDLELFELWHDKVKSRCENQTQFSSKKNSASLVGKRYSHFDYPVTLAELATLKDWLLDSAQVGKHAFFPFIKVTISRKRYAFDKVTRTRKKHPKGPKKRDICYAAHHDSLLFSWYAFKIDKLLDEQIKSLGLGKCVLAYRSLGLNNVSFAKEVFDYIATKDKCVALAFDVSKFFDTLDHGYLKKVWVRLLGKCSLPDDHHSVFKAMTRFRFIEMAMIQGHLSKVRLKECKKLNRYFHPEDFRRFLSPLQETNKESYGIPQGSPLSAVLSNLYMLSLDKTLSEFATENGGIYRRYCDDLLLVLPVACAQEAEKRVATEFNRLKLEMNVDKTERRFFSCVGQEGANTCLDEQGKVASLQYLGLEYDGNTVRIRPSSLSRYHQRMKEGVGKAVRKALSKKSKGSFYGQVFKRRLYEKYTHLGRSNFVSYVYAAYKNTKSPIIKRQVRGSIQRVNLYVEKELARRADSKLMAEQRREDSAPSARVKRMDFDRL